MEETAGMCDTPGFKLQEQPSIEHVRKKQKLCMPRNNKRVVQSSGDMLRSWRGNCDIQILVYDSPPSRVDCREISKLVDYIVAYTTKGGTTLKEERDTNKQLVLCSEERTGDVHDLKNVAKKIMNRAATKRLISKQEACVLLANLKLTSCSEMICHVSIARNKRISKDMEGNKSVSSYVAKYTKRPEKYHSLSMMQYFPVHRREQGLPEAIPHFTGVSGTPTFPVTEGYARHTLLVHKPWTEYPEGVKWTKEFDRFINSPECPKNARLAYDRVVQRHYDGTKFVDPIASQCHHSEEIEDEEDEAAMMLAGQSGKEFAEFDSAIFESIHRGEDFVWCQKPKVSVFLNELLQKPKHLYLPVPGARIDQ